jgi:uncharacterized protein (TIGR03032 family)
LQCTLALSTYQAGKLVFLSAKDENYLVQLPRTFDKPMGIAESEDKQKIALACKEEVILLANSPELARHYPKKPDHYDALYLPRLTYHTGGMDIHDIRFGKDGRLFAVNTLFSSIVELEEDYNFRPHWKPWFIDRLVSEDRCHLNGMVMVDGLPKYATAFNQGNTHQSWRDNLLDAGVLMDIESNTVITDGLAMPHSPRIFNDHLYLLQSASGELTRVDIKSGNSETILQYDGFLRGMDLYMDYLFIGISKLRKNSSTFAKLPFANKAQHSGILIVHLPTGSIAGQIEYLSSVDEIYDIHILADKVRPNILNTIKNDHKLAVSIPNATYWARTEENQSDS